MNYEEILNTPIGSDDFPDCLTVKDYFYSLLYKLWEEGEGFNGKRPFGNSGWEYDLYKPLLVCGAVSGRLDEDGCIEDVDTKAADALVFKLIDHVFGVPEVINSEA